MSTEAPRIYHAEYTRVHGPIKESLLTARQKGTISPEKILSLSPQEMIDRMRWWRIWTSTLISLSKDELDGRQAAQYLLEARGVMTTYYDNPCVVDTATMMKKDPEGHEYQMRAEMLRDKGRYCLCLASLTGNSTFVNQAKEYFEQAIQEANIYSSAWAVATMEMSIAQRQLGIPIDWRTFTQAYQIIDELKEHAGGWDRLAAVSWWYTKEAFIAGKRQELEQGLTKLQSATKNFKTNWILKYPLKEIFSSLFGLSRRITTRGISQDQFQI